MFVLAVIRKMSIINFYAAHLKNTNTFELIHKSDQTMSTLFYPHGQAEDTAVTLIFRLQLY